MNRMLPTPLAALALSLGLGLGVAHAGTTAECSPVPGTYGLVKLTNPNQLKFDVQMHCDGAGDICGWTEELLILRWSAQLQDWVMVQNIFDDGGAACGSGSHDALYSAALGTGTFHAYGYLFDGGGNPIGAVDNQFVFP